MTFKMINGTLVIDKGMLFIENRMILVWSSKFAVLVHFGLKKIVANGNIIKAMPCEAWEFGRLSSTCNRKIELIRGD